MELILLTNGDLLGFSWNEQRLLACLVGNHRRKINIELIEQFPNRLQQQVMYMIVILRLSVLLNRDRIPKNNPPIKIYENDGALVIKFAQNWLDKTPINRS